MGRSTPVLLRMNRRNMAAVSNGERSSRQANRLAPARSLVLGLTAWCVIACAALVALTIPGRAAGVKVGCTVGDLAAAIANANQSSGPDTLSLKGACNYGLTARDNTTFGPNGLPVITGKITILGSGAIIQRNGATPFRLFTVETSGDLELRDVTLRSGVAQGGIGGSGGTNNGGGGGGGTGLGGAIYNRGELTIARSSLVSNAARGGNGGAGGTAGGGTSQGGGGGGGGGGLGGNGGNAGQGEVQGGAGGGGFFGNGGTVFADGGSGGGGTIANGSNSLSDIGAVGGSANGGAGGNSPTANGTPGGSGGGGGGGGSNGTVAAPAEPAA